LAANSKRGPAIAILVLAALLISPAGAHVTGSFRHLWRDHIKPRLANAGSLNAPSNPVDWTKLKGVPPDFADGIDDTGGGGGGGNLQVEIVTVNGPASSIDTRGDTAPCPAGKVVVGGGADLVGPGFKFVSLDRSMPNASGDGWVAGAHEHTATADNWALNVNAICVVPTP
jgi:hypothetical protein